MSDEPKTALERLKDFALCGTSQSTHYCFYALIDNIKTELAAEKAKTHKEILTEAFDKCGIKSIERPFKTIEHAENCLSLWAYGDPSSGVQFVFDKDGSHIMMFLFVKSKQI